MEKLEIELPAASAAATEPGIEAVTEETLQEAQVLEAHTKEAEQPAPKSRSRRKKTEPGSYPACGCRSPPASCSG